MAGELLMGMCVLVASMTQVGTRFHFNLNFSIVEVPQGRVPGPVFISLWKESFLYDSHQICENIREIKYAL